MLSVAPRTLKAAGSRLDVDMPVGWKHSSPGVLRKLVVRRLDWEHWRNWTQVRRGFELPPLPRRSRRDGEIWAVFLVKNESDVLESTLRHTVRQGVDKLLVVDNGSTDGTLEILERLTEELPLHVGFDREVAYFQSEKMTYLARWAASRGADWVVPIDADEFWFSTEGTLAEHLRSTSDDILEAELHNLFPIPTNEEPNGIAGPLRFDHHRQMLRKTALRAHPLAWLAMGNHHGLRPGMTGGGLRIAHLPWRSERQFTNKVRQGAAALAAARSLKPHEGGHWRDQAALSGEQINQTWNRLLAGSGDESLGWRPVGPFTEVRAGSWETWPHNLDDS